MLPPFPPPPPRPRRAPRVSIVITNHNYAAYLERCLASALGQRDADVEVLVVDDGSTDGSREILARHADRVVALLQDRQGQKAAFNAGFAAAGGDVVMFLDADDELLPDAAAAVAGAFAREPGAARAIFRLQIVDEHGRPTGACVPAAGRPLPHGDVRREVLAFPDDLAWPPTSGNAFAAWALRRLLPLAVDDDPTGADSCLHPLVPMLGPVVALDRIGGSHRLHGANAHLRDGLDVGRSRLIVSRAQRAHAELRRIARELGCGDARPRSVTIAAHRLVSLRLGDTAGHPIAGDTTRRALGAGVRAAVGRADAGIARRAAYAAWFLVAAVAPAPLLRAIAEAAFQQVRASSPARRLAGR
ncbi:MAG: hypothetical protein QOE31_969 [Solirubrobacteraceae bacterium]|nr:hypothetical protein [Solirubrobacteraceae bacterium]